MSKPDGIKRQYPGRKYIVFASIMGALSVGIYLAAEGMAPYDHLGDVFLGIGIAFIILGVGYNTTQRLSHGNIPGKFGERHFFWLLFISCGIILCNIIEIRLTATGSTSQDVITAKVKWHNYGNGLVLLFLMSNALSMAKWARAIQKYRRE